MTLQLEGLANDFVGKGLCGGELILRGVGRAAQESAQHTSAGERGSLWRNQRLALRGGPRRRTLCGAQLRRAGHRRRRGRSRLRIHDRRAGRGARRLTGINFGAGMTGGLAWIYDEDGEFLGRGLLPQGISPAETWDELDHTARQSIRELVEIALLQDRQPARAVAAGQLESRIAKVRAHDSQTPLGLSPINGLESNRFAVSLPFLCSYIALSALASKSFRVSSRPPSVVTMPIAEAQRKPPATVRLLPIPTLPPAVAQPLLEMPGSLNWPATANSSPPIRPTTSVWRKVCCGASRRSRSVGRIPTSCPSFVIDLFQVDPDRQTAPRTAAGIFAPGAAPARPADGIPAGCKAPSIHRGDSGRGFRLPCADLPGKDQHQPRKKARRPSRPDRRSVMLRKQPVADQASSSQASRRNGSTKRMGVRTRADLGCRFHP